MTDEEMKAVFEQYREGTAQLHRQLREVKSLNIVLRDLMDGVRKALVTAGYIGTAEEVAGALAQVNPGGTPCMRNSGTGGNDPQECAWPHCQCDPVTVSVVAALEDEGCLIDDGKLGKAIENIALAINAYIEAKKQG